MVNLFRVVTFWKAFNIFSPREALSGAGISAQTSSHLLSVSPEGLVVRDLKLYSASQQPACASQEAWYSASVISFLGSYLYFVFFYTDCS